MATAFFGGAFFGGEFYSVSVSTGGSRGAKRPWLQKWRQELVDLLQEERIEKPLRAPAPVKKAIERVLEAAPEDDAEAQRLLRGHLETLQVSYKPKYYEALRLEIAKMYEAEMRQAQRFLDMQDEEDAITVLLLH